MNRRIRFVRGVQTSSDKGLEKLIDIPLEINLEEARPVGPFGMLWRMRSQECQEGLGVMVELTKALSKLKTAPAEVA